jgi:CzcA family heavy metal efflux pump
MNGLKHTESKGVAAFALRHARAITVIVAGLCVWGFAAMLILPSGIYPDVAFPRIRVIAERGEDSVENMMIGVTRPIEEAVNAVPGLRRVRSKTIRGASELALDFEPTADMRDALSQTRARIASLLPQLPPGVTTTIEQQTPSIFPVISFNVSLDAAKARGTVRDGADLHQWAVTDLKPRLSRLPDVFLVTVQGADTRQIVVEPDPLRLAAASLSLEDVTKIIGQSNEIEAVGVLERDYKQYQVLASLEVRTLEEIARLPVASRSGKTIHVRDVASVRAGVADRTAIVTGNGQDSVVVSLFMRYGGKITALSDHVNAVLKEATPILPAGVSLQPVYDQAELVRESLGGVRDAIVVGMILAIAVLWIFLGSARITLVAGITIPISVLGTFAVMSAIGESLNLMSLGGIAVAIGLIIDDAIVVIENIARQLREVGQVDSPSLPDKSSRPSRVLLRPMRIRAVISATREIFGAVVGSSLTTVVVFVPLVLLEGIVGQFFKAMAAALAIGILVSMVVSLTLTPIMAASRIGPRPGERTSRRWMDALARFYERSSRRLLRRPWLAALGLVLTAAAGVFAVREMPTGFLPQMDEGGFVLDYFMPVGTSLSETDKNCRKIESILLETPEVKSYSRRTGMELGFFATEQFTGDFMIGLKPHGERERSTFEVQDELRHRIAVEIPQIKVSFVQVMQDTINDMAGNPSPIEVKIFGNDYRVLQTVALSVGSRMEGLKGLVDVATGVSFGSPEITYRLDGDAISRSGLTSAEVEDQLKTALLGEKATDIRRADQLVPVVVRYGDAIRRDPTWLAQIPIADKQGRVIPASAVARIEEKTNVNELARENQQPVISVETNIASNIDLGTAAAHVRDLLAKTPAPRGVRFEVGGQVESQEKAFRNLMLVLSLAIGLVFLLLVAQFRSYRLPLIIFLTLPFSQIGGLMALRLTDTDLNIAAFMGLIMLVGLVVKNGIILIEYTAQVRAAGAPTLVDALATAGRIRLRPILMTSLTAIIALLPLALNLGSGAELQRPLAIAVIGGLSVSTLFTLLVIPVAHVLFGEPEHLRRDVELTQQ